MELKLHSKQHCLYEGLQGWSDVKDVAFALLLLLPLIMDFSPVYHKASPRNHHQQCCIKLERELLCWTEGSVLWHKHINAFSKAVSLASHKERFKYCGKGFHFSYISLFRWGLVGLSLACTWRFPRCFYQLFILILMLFEILFIALDFFLKRNCSELFFYSYVYHCNCSCSPIFTDGESIKIKTFSFSVYSLSRRQHSWRNCVHKV